MSRSPARSLSAVRRIGFLLGAAGNLGPSCRLQPLVGWELVSQKRGQSLLPCPFCLHGKGVVGDTAALGMRSLLTPVVPTSNTGSFTWWSSSGGLGWPRGGFGLSLTAAKSLACVWSGPWSYCPVFLIFPFSGVKDVREGPGPP